MEELPLVVVVVAVAVAAVSSLWSTRWWIRIGWHVSLASSVEKGRPEKMTRKSDAWSGSRNLSSTMDRFGVVASLHQVSSDEETTSKVSFNRFMELDDLPDHPHPFKTCPPASDKF